MFKVFNNRLAGYLMFNRCVLQKVGISKNSRDREMNLYFFNDNKRLQGLIEECKTLHHKE